MTILHRALAVLVAAIACQTNPAAAQVVNKEKLLTTVVIAKIPSGMPRAKIDEGIVASVPTYQKIPGLIRKVFTVNDDTYGGVYLWTDRAAAEAWFTPELIAKVKARSGIDPQIIYFDSPIQLDNRPLGN